MVHMIKVVGVEEVKRNLRKASIFLGDNVERGLTKASLFLLRKSQEVVPVQFGNLKGSGGAKVIGHGWHADAIVYYTASYAVYVHERTDAAHGAKFNVKHADEIANAHTSAQKKVWFNRGEKQQAKFLETPARKNRAKILFIIRMSASKGLKQ